MSMILTTVRQEKERIEYMLEKYSEQLASLPKGQLYERKVGEKTYFYLKYREGGKVISKYIAKDDAEQVRQQVARRRHIETMIKSLNGELEVANKVLEG